MENHQFDNLFLFENFGGAKFDLLNIYYVLFGDKFQTTSLSIAPATISDNPTADNRKDHQQMFKPHAIKNDTPAAT